MASTRIIELPPPARPGEPSYTRARYNAREAAAYLCVSRGFLYSLTTSHKVEYEDGPNRAFLYSQKALDAYAATRLHPIEATDVRPSGLRLAHTSIARMPTGSDGAREKKSRFR